jgi:hypothetical protein
MDSNNTLIIILVVLAIIFVVYYYHMHHCSIHCGTSEGFTPAGLSTTTGLSFYNKGRYCSDGNLLGSSSPYCESPGYVLF